MATNVMKASDLITLAKKALSEGWGYIWGATGQIHTQEAQNAATREHTVKYGQKWVGKHVLDCSGLFTWAYKQHGSFMYHGSNTMWKKYTTAKGKLVNGLREDGEPLKKGSAVFMTRGEDRYHVGVYIGDGHVIEAKGTYNGVVRSSVKVWNEWAELTNTVYDADGEATGQTIASAPKEAVENGTQKAVNVSLPVLMSGSSGACVKTLQRILNGNGNNCGSVDGKYGKLTEAAVRSFQKANGIHESGVCDESTWPALLGI